VQGSAEVIDTEVRLPRSFDPRPLLEDLAALRAFPTAYLEEGHRSGLWGGVSLYAQGGRYNVLTCGPAPYEPTEALARAPNLRAIVESFETEPRAVRVLTLDPGARIFEHFDPGISLDLGVVRLHVPIVTHPDVEFFLAGKRTRWRPGELWYGDFSFPHHAHNKSAVPRTHLVMDLVVTDAIRALFPREYMEGSERRRVQRALHQFVCNQKRRIKQSAARLLRRAG
jgi:hypothetical protein